MGYMACLNWYEFEIFIHLLNFIFSCISLFIFAIIFRKQILPRWSKAISLKVLPDGSLPWYLCTTSRPSSFRHFAYKMGLLNVNQEHIFHAVIFSYIYIPNFLKPNILYLPYGLHRKGFIRIPYWKSLTINRAYRYTPFVLSSSC